VYKRRSAVTQLVKNGCGIIYTKLRGKNRRKGVKDDFHLAEDDEEEEVQMGLLNEGGKNYDHDEEEEVV